MNNLDKFIINKGNLIHIYSINSDEFLERLVLHYLIQDEKETIENAWKRVSESINITIERF